MAKCGCPPTGGKGGKKSSGGKVKKGSAGGKGPAVAKGGKSSSGGKIQKGSSGDKKIKRKGHPANMFILYFLAMWTKYGGNMYCVAKECGRRWKTLPPSEKDKYKRLYCKNCKNCKACSPKKAK